MTSSSDIDAATEALIAQLMAEDLGESYQNHSAPIGASYHDYEEPLSSYERQCLDAESNPDDEGEQGSGWGPEHSDGVNGATATYESMCSIEPADDDTWDSRFIDEDGRVQEHIAPEQEPPAGGEDEDDSHSDHCTCSKPMHEELRGSPAPIVSLPACNVLTNPAGEVTNTSAPITLPARPIAEASPGPTSLLHDHPNHVDPSDHPTHCEPFLPSNTLAPNEGPSASTIWDVESQWDDGLDYSSYKGKGKAVRAYDEFKRGLRDGERESWDSKVADSDHNKDEDSEDSEEGEEGEIRDEDLPFIRIPWPRAEPDELLSRREESEVVEIRVGDDETLESILREISMRDERRRKGEDVVCVEGHEAGREEEVPGKQDVAAGW